MISAEIPPAVRDFVNTAQSPVVLSDPNRSDDPIVLANDAFCAMTGYDLADIVNRNCRFLQGPETHPHVVRSIAGDLLANRDSHALIRNYRKSGAAFDAYLTIFTLMDAKGEALLRIGSQFEVPTRRISAAFTAHLDRLRQGIAKLNAQADVTRQQQIDLTTVNSLTPTALLIARLEALKLA